MTNWKLIIVVCLAVVVSMFFGAAITIISMAIGSVVLFSRHTGNQRFWTPVLPWAAAVLAVAVWSYIPLGIGSNSSQGKITSVLANLGERAGTYLPGEKKTAYGNLADQLEQQGDDMQRYIPARDEVLNLTAEAMAWTPAQYQTNQVQLYEYDVSVIKEEDRHFIDSNGIEVTKKVLVVLGNLKATETLEGQRLGLVAWVNLKEQIHVVRHPQEVFHQLRIEGPRGLSVPALVKHSDVVPPAQAVAWSPQVAVLKPGGSVSAILKQGQWTDLLVLKIDPEEALSPVAHRFDVRIRCIGTNDNWNVLIGGQQHIVIDGEVQDLGNDLIKRMLEGVTLKAQLVVSPSSDGVISVEITKTPVQ